MLYDHGRAFPDGIQPIRVLQHNLTAMLENVHASFATEITAWMKEAGLQPGIAYDATPQPIFIRQPDGTTESNAAFATRDHQIGFTETFLCYVWCVSYALIVLGEELNLKPALGLSDPTKDRRVALLIDRARRLFRFGLALRTTHQLWDKNALPNPERYDDSEKLYIEKANGVFGYAMVFVLLHEMAHVVLKHTADLGKPVYVPRYERIERERLADQWAIQRGFVVEKNDGHDFSRQCGLVAGLCSLLLLSASLGGGDSHPDTDDRLFDGISMLAPDAKSPLWLIALQGLALWEQAYSRSIAWPQTASTPKEVFVAAMDSLRRSKTS